MHIFEAIRQALFVPIHPAGWPFVAIFAVIGVVLTLIWDMLFFPSLILTLWCVYFFRNPLRTTPQRDGLVVAPADGRVIGVDELPVPQELDLPEGKYVRVAIFMNVFDVHVNRAPMAGVITDKFYFPGAFFNASLDKSALENERLGLVMESDSGQKIGFIQIAGFVARRILCDAIEGDRLSTGQHYGLIRFGSRVDVWLPKPVKTIVLPGQKTLAGETILADYGRGAKAVTEGLTR